MALVATLHLNDGTTIGFDNYFDDDDPGSGWVEITKIQTARVLSGTPRPDTEIYYLDYLEAEPDDVDEEGNWFSYRHFENVVAQQFIGFDNLSYLTAYNVESSTSYDYDDDALDVFRSRRTLHIAFVDTAGTLTDLFPDFSAASRSVLFDQAGDRAGVLWVDEAGPGSAMLALASVDDQGRLVRRSERLDTSGLAPAATPSSPQIHGAGQLADGTVIVALGLVGTVQLAHLSARFDLSGPLVPLDGEFAGLVALPEGGFVVATVVRGAAGAATVYLRGFDEEGRATDPFAIPVANFQKASLALEPDGTTRLT